MNHQHDIDTSISGYLLSIIDLRIICYYYTPAPPNVEWGYIGFPPMSVRPSVRLSVRPSVHEVSGTFWKKLLTQFISYLAFNAYGVSLLTPFIFVFLASFLALWWPNIWPKIGLPELFEKNIGSINFFLKNSYLCSTRLQNINLYWIFLDEVGSDHCGGILSPFMGTACCHNILACHALTIRWHLILRSKVIHTFLNMSCKWTVYSLT